MTEKKQFSVNYEHSIAVYTQIINQIQFAIASGRIKPGDPLPSIRIMMETLNLNVNTVHKAYRDLETMGIVRTRKGLGTFVVDDVLRICKESIINTVKAHLIEAVAEGVSCGFTTSEIRAHVSDIIKSGCQPYETTKKK